jgi:prepilin peptidase CpaA
MNADLYAFLAVLGFTSIAVSIDLKTRRIPKWLTVTAAVMGLAYHVVTYGLAGLMTSLAGFATGFGILLVLWLIGSGGGGDVKLMGAVGAWLGAFSTLLVFIGSGLFAVVCTVALIVWNRRSPAPANKETLMRFTIPYALPVSLAIWTLFAFQMFAHQ